MAVVYILAEVKSDATSQRVLRLIRRPSQILEQPPTTPRVAKSIDYVLELCSEAGAMRMPVTLIWPLLISGLHCAFEVRPKVRSLFDAFASDYCEVSQSTVAILTCLQGLTEPIPQDLEVAVRHDARSICMRRADLPRNFDSAPAARGAMAVDGRRQGKTLMARCHARLRPECPHLVKHCDL